MSNEWSRGKKEEASIYSKRPSSELALLQKWAEESKDYEQSMLAQLFFHTLLYTGRFCSVMLDESGCILSMQGSGERAPENPSLQKAKQHLIGCSYLSLCREAQGVFLGLGHELALAVESWLGESAHILSCLLSFQRFPDAYWLNVKGSRFKDDNSLRYVISHEHVLKRERQEAFPLSGDENIFQWLMAHTDVCWITDLQSHVVAASPSAEEMFAEHGLKIYTSPCVVRQEKVDEVVISVGANEFHCPGWVAHRSAIRWKGRAGILFSLQRSLPCDASLFESFAKQCPELLVLFDLTEEAVLYANHDRFMGYELNENNKLSSLVQCMAEILEPNSMSQLQQIFQRLRCGEMHPFELEVKWGDREQWSWLAVEPMVVGHDAWQQSRHILMRAKVVDAERSVENTLKEVIDENSCLIQTLASASDSVIICEPNLPDFPIVFANQAFSELSHYELDEVIGQNCRFLQGPATDPRGIEAIRESIRLQQSAEVLILNYRKGGESFWNALSITPIFSQEKQGVAGEPQSRIRFYVGTQRDVTAERGQAEQEVILERTREELRNKQSKEECFQVVMHAMCTIQGWDYGEIWQSDESLSRVALVGAPFFDSQDVLGELSKRRASALWGIRTEEVKSIFRSDTEILWEHELRAVVEAEHGTLSIEQCPFQTRLCFSLELEEEYGGVMLVFYARARKRESQPHCLYVEELVSKLSVLLRRHLSKIALQESEERYRIISELSSDYAYMLRKREDGSWDWDWVTQAFSRITGYQSQDVKEMGGMERLLLEEDQEAYEEHLQRCLRKKKRSVLSFRIRTKTGEVRWLRDHIRPDISPSGAVLGVLGATQDITEQMEIEQAHKTLEEHLRQSQKMEAIGQLAGGVAHDFNNLLQIINGYSELLEESLTSQQDLSLLQEVQEAGRRAASLTGRLLTFSRKQVVTPVVLELDKFIGGIQNLLQRMIGEVIDFRVDYNALGCAIKADKAQLEQVLINMVVNARDAMPDGGELTVSTAGLNVKTEEDAQALGLTCGSYVLLSVVDNGVGMDRETLRRIYEPFFTTKKMGKGTGMGLSTIYGIVEQNGWKIDVQSKPNEGTAFFLYIPRSAQRADERTSSVKLFSPLKTQGRILLVEDEEKVRKLLRLRLESEGFFVLEARGSGEALLICERQKRIGKPIDMMLIDVVMPFLSGPELALRVASMFPDASVLFMSGYTDDRLVHSGIMNAGVELIQKPFSPGILIERLWKVSSKKKYRLASIAKLLRTPVSA